MFIISTLKVFSSRFWRKFYSNALAQSDKIKHFSTFSFSCSRMVRNVTMEQGDDENNRNFHVPPFETFLDRYFAIISSPKTHSREVSSSEERKFPAVSAFGLKTFTKNIKLYFRRKTTLLSTSRNFCKSLSLIFDGVEKFRNWKLKIEEEMDEDFYTSVTKAVLQFYLSQRHREVEFASVGFQALLHE